MLRSFSWVSNLLRIRKKWLGCRRFKAWKS